MWPKVSGHSECTFIQVLFLLVWASHNLLMRENNKEKYKIIFQLVVRPALCQQFVFVFLFQHDSAHLL